MGEKQELEWRELKKVRTCKEDRRIEEDRACSNREPGGAVEQWVCAQRVHTQGVSERAAKGETKQKRGAVETRQGVTARMVPKEPAAENPETQAQLKTPVKKARSQGAYQASRREAAKTGVAKITAIRGVRHPQIKIEGDDITNLTLDREGTKVAQTRRPTKVNISLNPTYVKVYFVNSTRHKAACTRHKVACREERADLLGKERENEEITKRLKVRRRVVLSPKALLAVSKNRTEREECAKVIKERRGVHWIRNPTSRKTMKSERVETLAGVPAPKKTVSAKGEASDKECGMNSKYEPVIRNTKGEE